MPRRTHLDRRTTSQRKRAGRYRESLRGRGIKYRPQRRK